MSWGLFCLFCVVLVVFVSIVLLSQEEMIDLLISDIPVPACFISLSLVPEGIIRPVISASVPARFISLQLVPYGIIYPVVNASVLT